MNPLLFFKSNYNIIYYIVLTISASRVLNYSSLTFLTYIHWNFKSNLCFAYWIYFAICLIQQLRWTDWSYDNVYNIYTSVDNIQWPLIGTKSLPLELAFRFLRIHLGTAYIGKPSQIWIYLNSMHIIQHIQISKYTLIFLVLIVFYISFVCQDLEAVTS